MAESWRHLYPFIDRWLDCSGARMHYVDEGSGSPVLMVHGNPTWSFYFRNLINPFRGQHRCIAPDHIGCGLSDKPDDAHYSYTLDRRIADLELLIHTLDLRDITLIVHDWGGMIGCGVALNNLERFSRIVVLNTAAFLMPPAAKLHWTLGFLKRVPFLPTWLIRGHNLFARTTATFGVCKPMSADVRAGYVEPYAGWWNSRATLRFVEDIPLSPAHPSYGTATRIDQNLDALKSLPMLILWGMRDFIFNDSFLSEWRTRFPQATVQTYPAAGHYILEDASADVIARVREFIGKTPPAARPGVYA